MIRLSSRLQPMPAWVVDYVLVHELAHLVEPGHGREFHRLVERLPPGGAGRRLPGGFWGRPGLGASADRVEQGAEPRRRRLMVRWDQGRTLADRFRSRGGEATHLYGYAMRGMAADWEAGGPVRTLCAGYESAPTGSALPLRMLAGVFRLVLTDQAPELARFYPCLGGRDDPAQAWPVLRDVIAAHPDDLRAALEVPPQTNEVGRSVALLAGLFDVVAATGTPRIRLLEFGASAGLNLLVDRFGFSGTGRFGESEVGRPSSLGSSLELRRPGLAGDLRGPDLRRRPGGRLHRGRPQGLRPAPGRRRQLRRAACC